MSSSKVMPCWSSTNSDPPRQPSPLLPNIHSDQSRGLGSMNFDDILRNICSDSQSFALDCAGSGVGDGVRDETVEEIWRDTVSGVANEGRSEEPAMTLEDFLTKAGAVGEEDVRVSTAVKMAPPPTGVFVMETSMMSPVTGVPAVQFSPAVCMRDGMAAGGFGVDFTNGMAAVNGGGGVRRGKRKAVVEQVALDKATQQKQKRMIKNRESAARSRERKQAYTVELETLVTQLEEDNARLLREEADMNRERYVQLMENIIPVTEKPRPPRVMKKVHSMEW